MTALSNLANQQGAGMSDMYGQQAGILAGQQIGAGANMGNLVGNTAGQLAGIATGNNYTPQGTGQTTQVSGILGQSGSAGLSGAIAGAIPGGAGTAAQGAASLAALASDVRLKENIKRVGTTPSGHGWYNWDWNKKGRSIAKGQPSYGVLAQEVEQIDPSAVIIGDDGYLRVDYSKV